METHKKKLLLKNIKQLLQFSEQKSPYLRMKDCN
jgi:hypothetical protein